MTSQPRSSRARKARDVVARLGRVIKQRLGEFIDEADQQLRDGLDQARRELDDELGERKRIAPQLEDPNPENPRGDTKRS